MTLTNRLTLQPFTTRGIDVYELLVDGTPVRDLVTDTADGDWDVPGLGVAGDTIPVLWHGRPFGVPDEVGMLLGERSPTLEGGRVPLYVCPECGDIGCGALTAVIERSGDHVTWRDFGWDDAGQDGEDPTRFTGGPFVFDAVQHDAELRRFAASSRAASANRPR